MPADTLALSGRARRGTLDPSRHLRQALSELAGGRGEMVSLFERQWASITFEGARYTAQLVFTGHAAVEAGERFIALLPEHEFAIPGQLVAEAAVTAADHAIVPEVRLAVTCELLLLKDA